MFVCQRGVLEVQSLLLAASLRRFLRCEHELVAAVPGPAEQWGELGPQARQVLHDLGVRTATIQNQIDPAYPIGNKVSALGIPSTADKVLLLDSDMLCLRGFADEERFAIPFNAKPADGVTFAADDATWRQIYAVAGLEAPAGRVRTTFRGQYAWPYFNSGFVAVDNGLGFGQTWLDCCLKIDAAPGTFKKRPWLDQIALPVAVHKLKLPYDCLDERYNYPVHRRPLREQSLPFFCHYHNVKVLRREPVLVELVRELVREHPPIGQIMAEQGEWGRLTEARPQVVVPALGMASPVSSPSSPRAAAPELLITGLPRSGTSYLCNLLHRFDNCVVLNEPGAIFAPLTREPIPFGVATLFRDVRRDILDGKPVRNKLVDGKVTEDTLHSDERCDYTPRVASADFVLGMKNTVSFLSRLEALRRAMPQARILACVRNPFDVIASWKSAFRHLQEADVRDIPVGHVSDPWLSGRQRSELESVAAFPDAVQRRAAYWNYLAGLILDSLDHLVLVRYDELALRPMEVLSRILDGLDAGRLIEPVEPSQGRSKAAEQLTPEDVQAIRALCSSSAAELGVFKTFPT